MDLRVSQLGVLPGGFKLWDSIPGAFFLLSSLAGDIRAGSETGGWEGGRLLYHSSTNQWLQCRGGEPAWFTCLLIKLKCLFLNKDVSYANEFQL